MLTEQEIIAKKNPVCCLCGRAFSLPTLASRFGGGTIGKDGVPMCSGCERQNGRNVIKRYQNAHKKHITEEERIKIIRSRTISGPRGYRP